MANIRTIPEPWKEAWRVLPRAPLTPKDEEMALHRLQANMTHVQARPANPSDPLNALINIMEVGLNLANNLKALNCLIKGSQITMVAYQCFTIGSTVLVTPFTPVREFFVKLLNNVGVVDYLRESWSQLNTRTG